MQKKSIDMLFSRSSCVYIPPACSLILTRCKLNKDNNTNKLNVYLAQKLELEMC